MKPQYEALNNCLKYLNKKTPHDVKLGSEQKWQLNSYIFNPLSPSKFGFNYIHCFVIDLVNEKLEVIGNIKGNSFGLGNNGYYDRIEKDWKHIELITSRVCEHIDRTILTELQTKLLNKYEIFNSNRAHCIRERIKEGHI